MDYAVIIWLLGIIVFVVLEAVTYQMVSIWFALGAVGGLIASLAGGNFTVQFVLFLVLSAIFIVCLRPFSKKLIKNKKVNTNIDSLYGKDVLILSDTNALEGTGKVDGMVWTVRSIDGQNITKGTTAKVEKIEGVKLIVKRKEG